MQTNRALREKGRVIDMLKRRTDLAVEAKKLGEESAAQQTKLEGGEASESIREG
jgi:hypothetical protein